LLFSPALLAFFFGFIGIYDALTTGSSLGASLRLIRHELIPATVNGMYFWVPVSLSIFTVVPDLWKLFVINIASFLYNILLSLTVTKCAVSDSELKSS
jgi:hypothetical protein